MDILILVRYTKLNSLLRFSWYILIECLVTGLICSCCYNDTLCVNPTAFRYIDNQHFRSYPPTQRSMLRTTFLNESHFKDMYPTLGFKVWLNRSHTTLLPVLKYPKHTSAQFIKCDTVSCRRIIEITTGICNAIKMWTFLTKRHSYITR